MSQETVEEQRPEDEVETEARREPQESVKDQEPAPEPELQQEAQGKRAGLLKDFKRVVDSVEGVGVSVISSSHLDTIGGGLKDTIRTVLTSRNSVVMVRVNEESLTKLDELVEAGVLDSRSKAAAFLIGEGIKARQGLFEQIEGKIDEIRKAREELHELLEEQ